MKIRSLLKNIDQLLRIYLSNQKLDILTINKTMLDSLISDDKINIRGFNLVGNDRNSNGDEVLIYIRNVINYKIRNGLIRIIKSK